MMGRPILTTANLQAHVTQLSQQDVIWNPLYDSAVYIGTTGQLQLTFFAAPQGQGTTSVPGAAGAKTIADTNMTAAGQLTKGNAFYMLGEEILFFPGVSIEVIATLVVGGFANDTYTFSKNGNVNLSIGSNRSYLQDGPLGNFPPATRLAVSAAVANGSTSSLSEVTYAVMSGEVYTIVPVYLDANLGFQQQMTWQAAQALPSTQNARIFLRMRGYLNRNAQ